MSRMWLTLVLPAVIVTGAGCGTITNFHDGEKVYGGLRIDGTDLGHACKELSSRDEAAEFSTGREWAIVIGSCVDLPLSLVADTLTLPVTCCHQIKNWSKPSDPGSGPELVPAAATAKLSPTVLPANQKPVSEPVLQPPVAKTN